MWNIYLSFSKKLKLPNIDSNLRTAQQSPDSHQHKNCNEKGKNTPLFSESSSGVGVSWRGWYHWWWWGSWRVLEMAGCFRKRNPWVTKYEEEISQLEIIWNMLLMLEWKFYLANNWYENILLSYWFDFPSSNFLISVHHLFGLVGGMILASVSFGRYSNCDIMFPLRTLLWVEVFVVVVMVMRCCRWVDWFHTWTVDWAFRQNHRGEYGCLNLMTISIWCAVVTSI